MKLMKLQPRNNNHYKISISKHNIRYIRIYNYINNMYVHIQYVDMLLNKFYSCYMETVVSIMNRRGLGIDTYCEN